MRFIEKPHRQLALRRKHAAPITDAIAGDFEPLVPCLVGSGVTSDSLQVKRPQQQFQIATSGACYIHRMPAERSHVDEALQRYRVIVTGCGANEKMPFAIDVFHAAFDLECVAARWQLQYNGTVDNKPIADRAHAANLARASSAVPELHRDRDRLAG